MHVALRLSYIYINLYKIQARNGKRDNSKLMMNIEHVNISSAPFNIPFIIGIFPELLL